MTIDAEKREEYIREIAERNADRLKDALLEALDNGWLIFHKGKPRERLNGYMKSTLAEDLPLLLDPDYLDKLSQGLAPPLLAVQMVEQRAMESSQIDPMTEQPMLPQTPAPPLLWPIILGGLPGYVFERLASDFRTLLKDMERRD